MSWQSERDEDEVFNSLSTSERRQYFEQLRQNGGNVAVSLDAIVGEVWFDEDDAPKGHRNRGSNE